MSDRKVDSVLVDGILVAISDAQLADEPICVGHGPRYDRRLTTALGLNHWHQSVVCQHVKHLVDMGRVRCKEVGTHTAILGERTKEYPVVQFEIRNQRTAYM